MDDDFDDDLGDGTNHGGVGDAGWLPFAAAATAYQAVGAGLGAYSYFTGPQAVQVVVQAPPTVDPDDTPINAADYRTGPTPAWDDYVGQEALKARLRLAIESAKKRGDRLPHVLLASGMPGVGKTTMARILAEEMDAKIFELQPKVTPRSLAEAAQSLSDHDILFIDEIHKLAETGKRGAEVLLSLLEGGVIFLDGEAITLPNITVVGATTDADMLPEPVIDRFKIRPHFSRYTEEDLARITCRFMDRHDYHFTAREDEDLIYGIANACQSTPRICEKFVMTARDLYVTTGTKPKITQVLRTEEVEPDGMTRTHIAYLTNMFKYNKRTTKDKVEWVAGEVVMMSMLRETKQGIQRIERFLMEMGYIDRTPSGRRLTPAGISKAKHYIKRGY